MLFFKSVSTAVTGLSHLEAVGTSTKALQEVFHGRLGISLTQAVEHKAATNLEHEPTQHSTAQRRQQLQGYRTLIVNKMLRP